MIYRRALRIDLLKYSILSIFTYFTLSHLMTVRTYNSTEKVLVMTGPCTYSHHKTPWLCDCHI